MPSAEMVYACQFYNILLLNQEILRTVNFSEEKIITRFQIACNFYQNITRNFLEEQRTKFGIRTTLEGKQF